MKEFTKGWTFDHPGYDKRSSNAVSAGDHLGVGKRQPVGHKDGVKENVPCLPRGKMKTMRDDEKG